MFYSGPLLLDLNKKAEQCSCRDGYYHLSLHGLITEIAPTEVTPRFSKEPLWQEALIPVPPVVVTRKLLWQIVLGREPLEYTKHLCYGSCLLIRAAQARTMISWLKLLAEPTQRICTHLGSLGIDCSSQCPSACCPSSWCWGRLQGWITPAWTLSCHHFPFHMSIQSLLWVKWHDQNILCFIL